MSLDALGELYKETILDHYQNPRNSEPVLEPTVSTEGFNPVCGDQIKLQMQVEGGVIRAIGLQGRGCAISQSAASMMTEAIKGLSLEEAERLARQFRDFMTEDAASDGLGDLEVLEGVRRFPVRIKCATLAWNTLQEAMKEYREGKKQGKLVVRE